MSTREITVDENDKPIGSKDWWEMQYSDIYRVAALWLTDVNTNEILLAQRKWTKKNDPGKWAASAAGTLEVGETYETNMVKEIEEEIGLTGLKLVKGPKEFIDDGNHRMFCQWFLASADKNEINIKIAEDEVEAIRWISPSDLLKDVRDNPHKYVPSIAKTLQVLGVQ